MKRHEGVCVNCNKYYFVKPSVYYKTINPTCCMSCAKKVRSKIMTGKGNHQYGLKGEFNSSYRSDLKLSIYGYVKVRCIDHPNADCDGFVLLHRLIMEQYLIENNPSSTYLTFVDGYPFQLLSKKYIVHHKDGNKLNNVIENLKVETLAEHSRHHYIDKPIIRDQITGRYKGLQVNQGKKLFKSFKFDAGLDISAAESGIVLSNGYSVISTDLFVNVPPGYVGLIWARSGLSIKYGISVGAGCIDSGYTGEVKVMLYNHGDLDYEYKIGDRIAQFLTIPINIEEYELVENFSNSTQRGSGGFGSTNGI